MKFSNETYGIRDLFHVNCPETCVTRILTDLSSLDRDFVPAVHDYWYSDTLKDVLNYLAEPRGDVLYISGGSGNGKTSLIVETAARLNWPCISISAGRDMKPEDLIGSYCQDRDGVVFTEGPLLTAARRGYIFVLNSVDQVSPDVVSVLRDAAEQQMINICNATEVIRVNRMFRLVVTGSACDVENGYSTGGADCINPQLMELCRICRAGQPGRRELQTILGIKFPKLNTAEIGVLSSASLKFIESFRGSEGKEELARLVNYRMVLRWAGLYLQCRSSEQPYRRSLDRALLFRFPASVRDEWYRILNAVIAEIGACGPVRG